MPAASKPKPGNARRVVNCTLAPWLQGKKSRAQFSNWLCYELTSSCKTKPPPLPKVRLPGGAQQLASDGVTCQARVPAQLAIPTPSHI